MNRLKDKNGRTCRTTKTDKQIDNYIISDGTAWHVFRDLGTRAQARGDDAPRLGGKS